MSPDDGQPPRRSLEERFVRYWDNALTPEELSELNADLAADESARRAFQQFCLQVLSIGESFAVEKACAQPAATWRRPAAAAVIAALFVAGTLLIVAGGRPTVAPQPLGDTIASLEDVTGNVRVSGGGSDGPGRASQALRSGQTVTHADGETAAEVRFRDGTRLVLRGGTSVQVTDDGQKRVRVAHGHLSADVRPQPPGRPMVLATPEAEVQVVGTLLSISGSQRRTDVAVAKGEVVVTQLSDRQSVTLRAGELATAKKDGQALLKRRPDLPDTFAIDFANLPPDWGSGEAVVDDLPPGSAGALRAEPWSGDTSGLHHLIRTHNAWTAALFELDPDSVLNCRFRLDVPGFFHVLLVARDPAGQVAVFEVPHFFRRRPAGVWHEVSVPVGACKRVDRTKADLPLPLVVFKIVVDSQAVDRGLTIDRLAITRGPARPPDPDRKD